MADQAVGASSRCWLEVFGESIPRITYNDQQLDTSCKCQVSDVAGFLMVVGDIVGWSGPGSVFSVKICRALCRYACRLPDISYADAYEISRFYLESPFWR